MLDLSKTFLGINNTYLREQGQGGYQVKEEQWTL